MAFADEYEKENRLLAYERRKREEEKAKTKAELDFTADVGKRDRELYRMEGYFIVSVVALMISLLGNFMQYLSSHAGQL